MTLAFKSFWFVMVTLGIMLLQVSCEPGIPLEGSELPLRETFSDKAMVDAIFWAEGGFKTNYPYGIKSINCGGNYVKCREICRTTVRRGRARFRQYQSTWVATKSTGVPKTFLEHFAARYCPFSPDKEHWVRNVRWFIRNPKGVNHARE